MIKLAESGNEIYIRVTQVEFELISKQKPADVKDGNSIPINWLETAVNNAGNIQEFVKSAKTQAEMFVKVLDDMTVTAPDGKLEEEIKSIDISIDGK